MMFFSSTFPLGCCCWVSTEYVHSTSALNNSFLIIIKLFFFTFFYRFSFHYFLCFSLLQYCVISFRFGSMAWHNERPCHNIKWISESTNEVGENMFICVNSVCLCCTCTVQLIFANHFQHHFP